jgi:uncharacterized iron-regulated membrane protein
MFRRIVFWSHLVTGVACGLVILMMSATGVLLTYERQLVAQGERSMRHVPATATEPAPEPLPLETLSGRLAAAEPAFVPATVTLRPDPASPAVFGAGRAGQRFVDRYTGEVLPDSAAGTRAFFDTITAWHRWFDADEDSRAAARAVTGASNLAFLFLLVSGAYLWLPPVFNRVALRVRVFFNGRADTAKARDYNWHHVFGIWSLLPLIVIVASATVFNYEWANTLLYRAAGDTPPEPGARPGPGPGQALADPVARTGDPGWDRVLESAAAASPGWNSLSLTLPRAGDAHVRVAVDAGTGGQPQRRTTFVLDAATAEITAEEPFSALSPGRRARSWVRFLHTGEAFGLTGQTVAGLVSLTSVIMVWTGLALAWRRLVSPLFRRRRLASANAR